jgi:hypothetical protein
MRKATREEILEFIKFPLITIDSKSIETIKWYTEDEGRYILENYILKYETLLK